MGLEDLLSLTHNIVSSKLRPLGLAALRGWGEGVYVYIHTSLLLCSHSCKDRMTSILLAGLWNT